MKDLQFQISIHRLVSAFKRFHLTIFIILLSAALATTVMLVYRSVLEPSDPNATNSSTSEIETDYESSLQIQAASRLQGLQKSSSTNTAPQLPSGKINPFMAK